MGRTCRTNSRPKLAAMGSPLGNEHPGPGLCVCYSDEKNERNLVEILPIPGLLSFLAKHDPNAEVKGLKAFPPADRPPVLINFIAFKTHGGVRGLFRPDHPLTPGSAGTDSPRVPVC